MMDLASLKEETIFSLQQYDGLNLLTQRTSSHANPVTKILNLFLCYQENKGNPYWPEMQRDK